MKPKFQSYSFLIITAVLVVSCAVGPKYQRPEIISPESFIYNTLPDTVLNQKWWEIFNDETLEAIIDTALKNNKDIQIAVKRIEQAAYTVGYNKADLWPAFGYSGAAQTGNIAQNGGVLDEPSPFYGGAANVNWELDFWGKYRRATQAAKAELLASEYGMRTVQIGIISNTASLYFQLQDYRARLIVSHETLETRMKSLGIISHRFENGIIPEIDLNQAQIQEAIAAANVPYYENLVANTEHSLGILLGQNPGPIESGRFSESFLPDSIPAGIPSDLLERRPDIAASEQLLRAQTARIGVAQAMRFPSISLTGSLGAASGDLTTLISQDAVVWSLAGNFTGPIFNFGKNRRRVQIERAKTEQFALEYENTILKAFAEVENALIGVNAAGRELVAYKRQLIAATNAEKLSWARYDGGVTSYLEVLETQRMLFDSQLIILNAKNKLLNSYVLLYKALGGGWITKDEMNAAEAEAE